MPGYVIGYDLNDLVSQISLSELNANVLQTINLDANDERLGIPTVLCKRNGVNQWYYGNEAEAVARRKEGTLVGKLISFAKAGAKLEIEGEAYDPVDLLILFVRRSLNLIVSRVNPDDIKQVTFTVEDLDDKMISLLNRITSELKIDKEKIVFQTYDESIYYYVLHQPEDLYEHSVIVLDYSNGFLKGYELWMNRKTTPIVGFVDRKDFEDIKLPQLMIERELSEEKYQRLDELIMQTLREYFAGKSVSSIFLIGDGFDSSWCDKTLRFLTFGRRVFQGKNLYSKGACYCSADKVLPKAINKKNIFLGRDKLKGNTGLRMRVKGKDEYVVLVDAGETYYSSSNTLEFILEKGRDVVILVTPLDGSKQREEVIDLPGLPLRPDRASRLRLEATFNSDTQMHVVVTDLGFGEFYLSSNKTWEKDILLT